MEYTTFFEICQILKIDCVVFKVLVLVQLTIIFVKTNSYSRRLFT